MPEELNKVERVKRIRELAREIDYLDRLIRKIPKGVVVDWANDYATGRARPITLLGQSDRDGYCARLERTVDTLAKELCESEDLIMCCSDPTTRTIIRMRFIEGKRVDEVAEELNYSREAVKWRSRCFFRNL